MNYVAHVMISTEILYCMKLSSSNIPTQYYWLDYDSDTSHTHTSLSTIFRNILLKYNWKFLHKSLIFLKVKVLYPVSSICLHLYKLKLKSFCAYPEKGKKFHSCYE